MGGNLENTLSLVELRNQVREFATPSNSRAFFEVCVTLALFFSLLTLAGYTLNHSLLLAMFLGGIAGLILVRIFILQHDCGHRSLFSTPWLNHWVGRLLALHTLTPFHEWNDSHHTHHRHTGQLSVRRHEGAIWLLTTNEYEELSKWKRFCYRLYHFPLVLFCIGPTLLFVVYYRLWWMEKNPARRRSMLLTNMVLLPVVGFSLWLFGWKVIFLVIFPSIVTASAVGVWFFYVQHIFENAYFAERGEYVRRDAIMRGGSIYRLPRFLEWLTGGIGYHAVHHLNPSIPSYRLRACWKKVDKYFSETPKFTLRESLQIIGLSLYDTKNKKMVRFS